MPFYRINGMNVHMRGRKLPAPCGAAIGIAPVQQACRAISGFLCDFPMDGRRTCDRALCAAHARQVGKNRHFCPAHHAAALASDPQGGLFTGLLEAAEHP